LRAQPTPIIARVAEGQVLLDPRTVAVDEETVMLDELRNAKREA
jgi:hypothetical protein